MADAQHIEGPAAAPWLARCPGCGYDLRGTDLDEKPCPECGWEATEAERELLRRRWAFDRRAKRRAGFGIRFGLAYAGISTPLAALVAGLPIVGVASVTAGALGFVLLVIGVGYIAAMFVRGEDRRRVFLVWCASYWWLLLPWFGVQTLAVISGSTVDEAVFFAAGTMLMLAGVGGWVMSAMPLNAEASIRHGTLGSIALVGAFLFTLFGGLMVVGLMMG